MTDVLTRIQHIGRQPRSALLKPHLPFPTLSAIELPLFPSQNLQMVLAQTRHTIEDIMANLPLRFQWKDGPLPSFKLMRDESTLFVNGIGQSYGNVWSRAARRQRANSQLHSSQPQQNEQSIFEFTIMVVYGYKTHQMQGTYTPNSYGEDGEDEDDDDVEDQGFESTTMIESHDFEQRLSLCDNNHENDMMIDDENQSHGTKPDIKKSNNATNAKIVIRWTRGTDQVMWESFCGMIRSKMRQSW